MRSCVVLKPKNLQVVPHPRFPTPSWTEKNGGMKGKERRLGEAQLVVFGRCVKVLRFVVECGCVCVR